MYLPYDENTNAMIFCTGEALVSKSRFAPPLDFILVLSTDSPIKQFRSGILKPKVIEERIGGSIGGPATLDWFIQEPSRTWIY